MDALLASAGPLQKKRRTNHTSNRKSRPTDHQTIQYGEEKIDPSLASILPSTSTPNLYRSNNLAKGSGEAAIQPDKRIGRIADKKLRARVARTDVATKRARKDREEVNEWLNQPLAGTQGGIEVDEEDGERTWRIKQSEIVEEVEVSSGRKRFDLKFEDMGTYMIDYTRNGRHLAIASSRGHIATFDWQAGKLHSEIQLRESVRAIKFLQSESFYAVAQKKYVFIYDQNGVELHKLKQHIDPTHLEYLPYHYLLTTVGHAGYLKYHDVSTGVMLTQIPTHLGSPATMSQNPHSAIIHIGHSNGTMTLWSPNSTSPHVKLLAHRGPVVGIAVDPSASSAGRYCATAGLDGSVKIWDGRMWGKEVRSWGMRNSPTSLAYSGRGMLAVGGKSGVSIFRDTHQERPGSLEDDEPPTNTPYLTLPLPKLSGASLKFCPFDDILGVGHEKGVSSLLVPGSGEANFDSAEADVFESHTRRREREVRSVLEKIRPELITFDTDFLGGVREERPQTMEERIARSYRQLGRMERLREKGEDVDDKGEGAAGDEDISGDEANLGEDGRAKGKKEKKVKKKMKGRGGSMSRYLAKKKQNVVDSSLLAMRAKLAAQNKAADEQRRIQSGEVVKETGALARFG